jgi:hypothetical protein
MRVMPGRWLVLALLPFLCAAADPTRFAVPPAPPKFAPPAHGVLFADDFSHGLGAWQADQPDVWSAWHGMLRADLPDQKQLRSVLRGGDSLWTDYALDFDTCMMRGVDKGAVVRLVGENGVGVDLRGGTYQDVVSYIREWSVGKAAATNANATWNHLRIEVRGSRMIVRVNGEQKLDRAINRAEKRGGIALAAYTGGAGECTVYYDNVIVTAL